MRSSAALSPLVMVSSPTSSGLVRRHVHHPERRPLPPPGPSDYHALPAFKGLPVPDVSCKRNLTRCLPPFRPRAASKAPRAVAHIATSLLSVAEQGAPTPVLGRRRCEHACAWTRGAPACRCLVHDGEVRLLGPLVILGLTF